MVTVIVPSTAFGSHIIIYSLKYCHPEKCFQQLNTNTTDCGCRGLLFYNQDITIGSKPSAGVKQGMFHGQTLINLDSMK